MLQDLMIVYKTGFGCSVKEHEGRGKVSSDRSRPRNEFLQEAGECIFPIVSPINTCGLLKSYLQRKKVVKE